MREELTAQLSQRRSKIQGVYSLHLARRRSAMVFHPPSRQRGCKDLKTCHSLMDRWTGHTDDDAHVGSETQQILVCLVIVDVDLRRLRAKRRMGVIPTHHLHAALFEVLFRCSPSFNINHKGQPSKYISTPCSSCLLVDWVHLDVVKVVLRLNLPTRLTFFNHDICLIVRKQSVEGLGKSMRCT